MEKIALIENADYSISAEAVAELNSSVDVKNIFAVLDRQLGTFPQTLTEGQCPDYYPKHGILNEDI